MYRVDSTAARGIVHRAWNWKLQEKSRPPSIDGADENRVHCGDFTHEDTARLVSLRKNNYKIER